MKGVGKMGEKNGSWYGDKWYFGLHYDLHANANDKELGTHCSPKELCPMLKKADVDFVQTDCKGHPGMTSWFTQVKDGTVSPGVVKDALAQWREATKRLGLPLHCHYSGIWDMAAARKHPEWAVVKAPGADKPSEKMCPRGPYLKKLLIPQLFEAIDRYGVDGFWIDGDIWGVEPCYCKACVAEFRRRTGIRKPPVSPEDEHWTAWMNFHRDSFLEYVKTYVEAVHAHKPGVKICSNWLQTLRNPGQPAVPQDWISGDNNYVFGMDGSRCEARWLCHRGKPWDIMLWSFSKTGALIDESSPWTIKPVETLEQEAAMLLSTGGNLQIYETTPLRTGQLVPWRIERLREVSRFVKRRRRLCQNTETLPMAAVLHSEVHYYSKCHSPNLLFGYDIAPVEGATWLLSDCHYGVDILDEWAIRDKLADFPVVVVPEQIRMSDAMVDALKRYVQGGGRLFLTGVGMEQRFGLDFLGLKKMDATDKKLFHVPIGTQETTPIYSEQWGLMKTNASGRAFAALGDSPARGERLTGCPAVVFARHGKGTVAYMPADLFHYYQKNNYPDTRRFMAEVMKRLFPKPQVSVDAPVGVDFVARRRNGQLLLHFINRASGNPTSPRQGMIEEIPPLGPVRLSIRLEREPRKVTWHFEDSSALDWQWLPEKGGPGGRLAVTIAKVGIHGVLQIV